MKKLLLALWLAAAQAAAAAVVPTAYLEVRAGDGSVRIESTTEGVRIVQDGDIQSWFVPGFTLGETTFSDLLFSFDPDPFINFSVSLTKFNTVSTTYSFAFGSPYVGGPYDLVTSQLMGSIVSIEGATLTGIAHATEVDGATVLSTTMNSCTSSGGTTTTCAPTSGSAGLPSTGPTGFFVSRLTLSIDAPSSVSFAGRSDILRANAVPEATTVALVMLALTGIGGLRRRDRRGR